MPPNLNFYGHLNQLIPPYILRTFREDQVISIAKKKKKEKPIYEKEKELLYCISCLKLITSGDQRTRMGENHEHTFFNPGGFMFKIGCFRDAPGSVPQGIPTEEFTWFKGFSWCLAQCGGCFQHIGWHYLRNDQGDFWGLILNMLTNK